MSEDNNKPNEKKSFFSRFSKKDDPNIKKPEKKPSDPAVPFYQLWRFASPFDLFLLMSFVQSDEYIH
ncbi:hypothetical protein HK096_000306 [Nowakowskiella sp. JEL0078]|nr:hypothetical protein HK096_000306 [Nowakowskiella sp. JEL0078]